MKDCERMAGEVRTGINSACAIVEPSSQACEELALEE